MKVHGQKLTDSFEENKKIVNELVSVSSKKLRNTIAGYATRLVKEGPKHGNDEY
jgi:small subunit ribosomal protein S17e